MDTDWGALYREHVRALSAVVGGLDEVELATVVPATPAWTVRDVVAHLAGGAADHLSGRMDGAPGPSWTARHVSERSAVAVDDLLAEIHGNADAVVASVGDNPRPAVVWDMVVHHTDIHEALERPRLEERLWLPVAEALAPRAPELADAVPPYEVFRAVFSRRSRRQIRGWGVSDDRIEEMSVFGPRDDDQPVPS